MEEKTLLVSTRYNTKRVLLIIMLVVVVGIAAWFLNGFVPEFRECADYGLKFRFAFRCAMRICDYFAKLCIGIVAGVALILALIYGWLHSYEMTITDKRVYGKTAFGKRVDLPIDSVSAVGMCAFKGVSVATSSGRILFRYIKNRDEIHKCISNLLVERQSKAAPAAAVKQGIYQGSADELKKFKDLLDSGVITQEEFDAQKKQLLGL